MINKIFFYYCKKNQIQKFRVFPKEICYGRKNKIIFVIQELGILFRWNELILPELKENFYDKNFIEGIVGFLNDLKK